jgi:hypothetical protein
MGSVWAGQSQKTSFCLIDVIKLEGNSNTGVYLRGGHPQPLTR